MKKIVLVLLALFIAVPMVSDAGSVTSRWDMNIGGYIKFDVGYMSQGTGVDYRLAGRESQSGTGQNLMDEYPATNWFGGESRLNFAIKGPDAWGGAKTSAFLEGDFRGISGHGGSGYFTLRHAFMDFKWANTTLLLGHTWQPWGLIPSFNILAFSENHFMKGATRVPQIRITQNFTKEFSAQFAVAAPNQTLGGRDFGGSGNVYTDDRNRALLPDTSLDLKYTTDKCGKIGPWKLTFGLGGMFGKEKVVYDIYGAPTVAPNDFEDDDVDRWGASFYGYIPIIPEKKGNKANALGLTWNVFTGQGLDIMLPASPSSPYDQDTSPTGYSFAYPSLSGGWAQLTYYWTNSVWSNALWGYQTNNLSSQYRTAQVNAVKNLQNFIVNIMYDVNPAVRFGLEYTRITTAYGRAVPTGKTSGSLDAVRFGAYYFF